MTIPQTLLMDLSVFQLTGIAGFFFYIFAFGAVQFDWLNGNSTLYSICNIVAASLVAVSLIADFNLASALIQGSWILIGFTGLILRWRRAAVAQSPFQTSSNFGPQL